MAEARACGDVTIGFKREYMENGGNTAAATKSPGGRLDSGLDGDRKGVPARPGVCRLDLGGLTRLYDLLRWGSAAGFAASASVFGGARLPAKAFLKPSEGRLRWSRLTDGYLSRPKKVSSLVWFKTVLL